MKRIEHRAIAMAQLRLHLLGPMHAELASEPLSFPRKKAVALLARLATPLGQERSREELCALLWGRTADAQARDSLRQTLFALRKTLQGFPGLIARGDALVLEPEHVWADVGEFEAAVAANSLSGSERAVDLYAGDFMQGFGLREDGCERWLAAERSRFRDMALAAMQRLLSHYTASSRLDDAIGVVRSALDLDPLQERLHRALIRLYVATDRREMAYRQFETCRDLLRRELGVSPSNETKQACTQDDLAQARAAEDTRCQRLGQHAGKQEVKFCSTADGVRIAYATTGTGPPIVKAPNWMTHLEYEWDSPVWRHFLWELSRDRTLIRFDQRGNGLSDWDVADISFEAFVSDLEAVSTELAFDLFPLLGISQGCAISIAYAVRHPERVSRLILLGGFIYGAAKRSSYDAEKSEALNTLIRDGWGKDNPALRQMYTTSLIPDGSAEQMLWYNELMRVSASPENAVRLRGAFAEMDVSGLLGEIAVPTLVLHARNDAIAPFEESRRMAAEIPGARFVALEGNNHILLEDEPAWPRFVDELRRFLESSD